MFIVVRTNVRKIEPNHITAEASELEWPVGYVPHSVPTTLGNGFNFLLRETRRHDGEIQSWHYTQLFSGLRLTVFND
jgi:hypothetical protein